MIRLAKILLLGLVALTFVGCSSMFGQKSKPPAPKSAVTQPAAKKPKAVKPVSAAAVDTSATSAAETAASATEPPASVLGSETPSNQSGAAEASGTQIGPAGEPTPTVAPPAPRVMPGPASRLPSNQRLLNMAFPVAWSKVGTALQSSGYRIMQHDRSMGAIFVIDVKANAGVIKPDTPIYQVKLTAAGNQTKLTVLTSGGKAAGPRVTVPLFSALTQKGV